MSDEVRYGDDDSQPAPTQPAPTRSRRRFLASVGLTGLTVAAAVFGRSMAAYAGNYGCCNLAIYPPNVTYDQCVNGSGVYTWACSVTGQCRTCWCCENRVWAGDHYIYTASAGRCSNLC